MAKARDDLPGQMTVEEFLIWLEDQPEAPRYELVAGEPVAMAPERVAHARLKAEFWLALRNAIRNAKLACEAFPDGVGVRIDDASLYQPDVVVRCGDPIGGDTVLVPEPAVVVEVLSPNTWHVDTGRKLAGYFGLPSVIHYLIVPTDKRAVIHHQRRDDGAIETRIVTAGTLDLDPPGLSLDIDRIYREAASPESPQ